MVFVVSGQVGIDLTQTTTVPQHTLGTTVQTTDGGLFEYVQVLSAVAQYNTVVINADNKASNATTTNAAEVKRVGVAQVSIALSSFGWVQRQGKAIVNVAAGCQDFVALFTTGTPGVLDDATVSEALVLGINTVTSTSTASAVTAIIGSPAQIFPFANPA